ncbi:MAG: PorT family protein [Bacteroidia bacterium]|nr:PorT family protein [Bacteroidia bacterium]
MQRLSGIFLLLVLSLSLVAQKQRVKNLHDYDDERLHFGFSLAVNQAWFDVTMVKDWQLRDTLLSVSPGKVWGFNLTIISDLRIHQFATLRFIPTLSFQDRNLFFTIEVDQNGSPVVTEFKKNIESTRIEFPLNLKIRSSRLNNISAYIVGGGKYGFDLASQEDVKNSTNPKDVIIKLRRHDWALEAGFGIDYYFPYFKFSTEIKGAWGLRDLLVHEGDAFSSAIEKLNSRLLLLSLHFEG